MGGKPVLPLVGQPAPMAPGEFQSASARPRVAFNVASAGPPSPLYITRDDQLQLVAATSRTNEVVTVNARLLLPTGEIKPLQFVIRPTSNRAIITATFQLAEGFLLSVSCIAATAITRGQTFLRVLINTSAAGTGQPGQVLFADYVTTQFSSAFPGGRLLAPTEGPGFITLVQTANPAAGADFATNIPSNTRWRIGALNATLGTSAVAANRQASLIVGVGGPQVFRGESLVNQTAGTTFTYQGVSLTPYSSISALLPILTIPPNLFLSSQPGGGNNISSLTNNLQAADQWSNINMTVEEWLENV